MPCLCFLPNSLNFLPFCHLTLFTFVLITEMAARALLFRTTHNQRLIMPRDQHNVDFHGLFDYFERSRINTVLTNHPALYRGYLEDFWRDIRVIIPDAIPGENGQLPVFPPPFIRFSINNQQFQFTAADLRLILNLGTVAEEDGPTEFPNDLLWGCFHRMGYAATTICCTEVRIPWEVEVLCPCFGDVVKQLTFWA